jgi:hypothetical protein
MQFFNKSPDEKILDQPLIFLRNLSLWLRMRVVEPLRSLGLIEEVNTNLMNSLNFVVFMELKGSLLLDILHNRMEWLKGRIEPSWIWLEAC